MCVPNGTVTSALRLEEVGFARGVGINFFSPVRTPCITLAEAVEDIGVPALGDQPQAIVLPGVDARKQLVLHAVHERREARVDRMAIPTSLMEGTFGSSAGFA